MTPEIPGSSAADASSVELLCSQWGTSRPQAAMVRAIYRAFPDLADLKLPIDIRALAGRRGIIINETMLATDGRLSPLDGGGYLAEIEKTAREERKRFTCGHEIGHTLLFDAEKWHGSYHERSVERCGRELKVRRTQEEDLCDAAASELLMPTRTFLETVRRMGKTAGGLLRLSKKFRTSLWATANRLVATSRPRLCAVYWREDDSGGYESLWHARGPRSRGAKPLFVAPRSPFFRSLQSPEGRFRGYRWLSLGGAIDRYFVDGVCVQPRFPRVVLTVIALKDGPNPLPPGEGKIERDAGFEQMSLY
jgi:hypothetical protein